MHRRGEGWASAFLRRMVCYKRGQGLILEIQVLSLRPPCTPTSAFPVLVIVSALFSSTLISKKLVYVPMTV